MSSDQVLKKIKKTYGERVMKMCRTHFPTILENDEKLYEILQANFADTSTTLYDDIQKNELEEWFVDFIFEKYNIETEERVVTEKTPYELLDEAGYELTECHTEKEIQSFKKYYAEEEALCTFDGGRLDDCIVFWAVKKNVDEIKRKDFEEPKRDDEYGTSVMSIQFNRMGTTRVSIKNRYNHTVNNPDATLGNNLEKIAPGLTHSFEKILNERGLQLDSNNVMFALPDYIRANDGKYYKYNSCIGDTYYCPGNIVVVNGEVQKIEDPEKHCLVDCFLIDMENKTISMCDEKHTDAFIDGLTDIQKISIEKDKTSKDGQKQITIQREGQEEPILITIDRGNKIIGYKNHGLREVADDFLQYSCGVEQLDIPNIETVGNNFCKKLQVEELNLPKLKRMGNNCCLRSEKLKTCDFSSLEEVGNRCFEYISDLEKANFPRLRKTGNRFFKNIRSLKTVEFPALTEMGDECLAYARGLEQLSAPKLKKVGNTFAGYSNLRTIYLQELEEAGHDFGPGNKKLESIYLPKTRKVGEWFLENDRNLKSLRMPSLKKAGSMFLSEEFDKIEEFETPKLSRLQWFFSKNRHITSIITKAKKTKELTKEDISNLDKQTVLLPEEIKAGEQIVETPVVEEIKNDERVY